MNDARIKAEIKAKIRGMLPFWALGAVEGSLDKTVDDFLADLRANEFIIGDLREIRKGSGGTMNADHG